MSNRIALVTGCSRGVGAAISEVLLERNWRVHGISRSAPSEALLEAGLRHHPLDLGDLAAVEEQFHPSFASDLGLSSGDQIALINNAGVLEMAPSQELDLGAMETAFRINVTVPAWLMGWFLQHTPEVTRLDLINLSSGAASSAYPGWLTYCTSKAALRMAGKCVAADVGEQLALSDRPIHVLDYAPGVVATTMQAEIRAADPSHFPRAERFHDLHANGDLSDPMEPALEIADLLERKSPPAYEERRLGD